MSAQFEITAESRDKLGTGSSRRLRHANVVPGVVYGGDGASKPISLQWFQLKKALENESFYSQILKLNIDGKTEQAVLKALHRHPSKNLVLHADFLRVKQDTALVMKVPLHFIGEDQAPGVKQDGGVIFHQASELEIKCLPADLPEFIEIDVSNLALDQTVHLSDIKLPKGVEITALALGEEHDLPVVTIHIPSVAPEPVETEEAAEGEEAAAEGDADKASDGDSAESGEDKD